MKPGVKATEPIALDDLFDRFNGIQSRLIAQIRVSDRIRGRHRAVRYQNRGLNNVFGEFKRTLYKVGQLGLNQRSCQYNLQARGEVIAPAQNPERVNVKILDAVGPLPGLL